MKTDERKRRVESNPLDVIRVEAALSRFPIHSLAKRKKIAPIAITQSLRTDPDGGGDFAGAARRTSTVPPRIPGMIHLGSLIHMTILNLSSSNIDPVM